jgi:15-cis-phytoene synthase/lycopene beta-cyclase
LRGKRRDQSLLPLKWLGASILTGLIALGIVFLQRHGEGFYMGLILTWAGPFALLLWCVVGIVRLHVPS